MNDWQRQELESGMRPFLEIHRRIEQLKDAGKVTVVEYRAPQALDRIKETNSQIGEKKKRGRPKGVKNRILGQP